MLSLKFDIKQEGNRFHSNIFASEDLFLGRKGQIKLKKTKELEAIFADYKRTRRNMPIFYGYPLFMDFNGDISPVFFVEVFFDEKGDSIVFTKESVCPEFNYHVLARSGMGVEEIRKIRAELDEETNFRRKAEVVAELLNLRENIISSSLDTKSMENKGAPKFVNKAILYFGERTGFTKGLIEELQRLRTLPSESIKPTSLGFVFGRELKRSPQSIDIIEVFHLNDSQKKAVKSAFTSDFTVITGPPGTGKSQVVLNIVANSIMKNETVLFASKNNQAVDVVTEKLNSLFPKDLIIRTGSGKYRKSASVQIESLLSGVKPRGEGSLERHKNSIKEMDKEIESLEMKILSTSELNEKLENLQNEIDTHFKEVPMDLYSECKDDDFSSVDMPSLESDLKRPDRLDIIERILNLLFRGRLRKRYEMIFRSYYDKLSPGFKAYLDGKISLERKEVERFLRWVLAFKKSAMLIKDIESLKKSLIKSESVYDVQDKISRLQQERVKLSREILEHIWLEKLGRIPPSEKNRISRYLDASRKLESYIEDRKLWRHLAGEQMTEFTEILKFIPAWVVTNLSARKCIPFEAGLFDLVIIDEASQCDIASALPLLYRARRAVIIGDPKQLKHISVLRESEDKKAISMHSAQDLFLDYSYTKNSLYDLADRIIKSHDMEPVLLNRHYRSHRNIIEFSNQHFYDRKLSVDTDEKNLVSSPLHPKGIIWVHTQGKMSTTKSPYNREEALKVIDILRQYAKSGLGKVSFGVVTLFRAQMELISDLIKKQKELSGMDITIGTAHRFQGDEKDIIIFSPAVSIGSRKTTMNWIHSTIQLLNVAITRARSVLVVVGDRKICNSSGGILKGLVEYCDMLNDEISFDSPVEEVLYTNLQKAGIRPYAQYWVNVKEKKPYRLDFALFVNSGRRSIKYDIEVDGDKAHSGKADYDALRDIHLRGEGWRIRRFHAREVANSTKQVVEQIKRFC